jgi:quinol monooxygenase YgiN
MATQDKCCSVAPYFKVKPGQMQAFKSLCERFVAKAAAEPGCLYYGFAFDGDTAFCREGYVNADALLLHVSSVAPLLGEAAKISDLERLEIHGPESELEKIRVALGEFKPRFFALEYGVRK